MRSLRSLSLAGLVTLCACAPIGPDYRRPAIDLPADYPETSSGAAVGLRAD